MHRPIVSEEDRRQVPEFDALLYKMQQRLVQHTKRRLELVQTYAQGYHMALDDLQLLHDHHVPDITGSSMSVSAIDESILSVLQGPAPAASYAIASEQRLMTEAEWRALAKAESPPVAARVASRAAAYPASPRHSTASPSTPPPSAVQTPSASLPDTAVESSMRSRALVGSTHESDRAHSSTAARRSNSFDRRPSPRVSTPRSASPAPRRTWSASVRSGVIKNEGFATLDADSGGTIDFQEFCAFVARHEGEGHTRAELQERFAAIDTDGNGQIDVNEYILYTLREGLRSSQQRVVDVFHAMDTNGCRTESPTRDFYRAWDIALGERPSATLCVVQLTFHALPH